MKKRVVRMTAFTMTALLLTGIQPAGTVSAQRIQNVRTEAFSAASAAEETEPEAKYAEIPVTKLEAGNLSPLSDTDMDYTEWWYSKWEDCRYLFLPATADRKKLTLTFEAEGTLKLNGKTLKSGETTALLSTADEFQITVGEKDCGTLKIMQSNLGCIYLSTASGGLDHLDSNRFYTETGNVLMLNAEGGTEYSGAITSLKAHGNSSWDYSLKKPYNLKLPKKADLYGLGSAKKWVLLANYLDHSMMRNRVTEEIARTAGMEYVMDTTFVDLYADGAYRGTYQLSEKIQVQKNRVNIRDLEEDTEDINSLELSEYPRKVVGAESLLEYMENSYKYYDIPNDPEDITGGYLLQFQLWNRYGGKAKSGFVSGRGLAVQIDGPEYASKAQVEYIRSFFQDAEDAVYSKTGYNEKGKHYSEYIDVDSLITAYLIQEISMNIDGTSTSFFCWKDSDLKGDGKLHFGPAWDFDLSYDNFAARAGNSDGQIGCSYLTDNLYTAYFAISGYIESGRPTAGKNWIGTLYQHDEFIKRVAKNYYQNFEPILNKLTEGDDPYMLQLARTIEPSAEMSNARWHTYGGRPYTVFGASSGANFMESVDIVRDFMERRKNWLSSHWADTIICGSGDVNADGSVNAADAAALQKWLLCKADAAPKDAAAADLDGNGILNAEDLTLLRRAIKTTKK